MDLRKMVLEDEYKDFKTNEEIYRHALEVIKDTPNPNEDLNITAMRIRASLTLNIIDERKAREKG